MKRTFIALALTITGINANLGSVIQNTYNEFAINEDEMISRAKAFANSITGSKIVQGVTKEGAAIVRVLDKNGKLISGFVKRNGAKFYDALPTDEQIIGKMKDARDFVKDSAGKAKEFFSDAGSSVRDKVNSLGNAVKSTAADIKGTAAVAQLSHWADNVKDAFKAPAKSTTTESIKNEITDDDKNWVVLNEGGQKPFTAHINTADIDYNHYK